MQVRGGLRGVGEKFRIEMARRRFFRYRTPFLGLMIPEWLTSLISLEGFDTFLGRVSLIRVNFCSLK